MKAIGLTVLEQEPTAPGAGSSGYGRVSAGHHLGGPKARTGVTFVSLRGVGPCSPAGPDEEAATSSLKL